ncbi:MAG: class I SAM-dependent methyltransferase [Microscillaceae bacterium]|jgi:16S rRNA G966 N2-methylase RsmD|nr:class I SAM-dependent methyltransferase [Microscillaceae bacterium]
MRYWFYLIFGLLCHCRSDVSKQIPQLTRAKADFLANVDMLLDLEVLQKKLDSAGISPDDIFAYCRQSQAQTRKVLLIKALYEGMQNYLQEENPNYWLAIMYNLDRFAENIFIFKEKKHQSFMDIGSGNGEKPYAALCLGFAKAYGLEYSDSLVKISRQSLQSLIKRQQMEIIHADALQTDPKLYQTIDFIYMYSPIKNHQKQAQLYHRVMQNMHEGAILLEMRMVYRQELETLSGYKIPELMDLVVKKEKGKYYYARHFVGGRKEWYELKKNE